MCRPTRTNSNLQTSAPTEEREEERQQKLSDDCVTLSVALSPLGSLKRMDRMSCRKVTAIGIGAVVVLMRLHFQVSYSDEDIIPQQVCSCDGMGLSQMISRSAFAFYFATIACLVSLFSYAWRDKVKEIYTSLTCSRGCGERSLKPRCVGGGSFGTLSSLSRVASVDVFKNLSMNLLHSLDSCSLRAAFQAITRKECFARSDYIERLSMSDLAILFRYAANVNVVGFDKAKFISEQTPIVRAVVTAMGMAVRVSRGRLKEPLAIQEEKRTEGDMDALYFVAATRVFAEWRTLRLVPKGFQRYAVGLSLAYRDVLQNLEKIERGVHNYLRLQDQEGHVNVASPTLQQLLRFEIDKNFHKQLPKLEEKSAGSGILWTKRQLHYQVATLSNSLDVPECYPTAKDAASAAYRIVYDHYHGWAVKQIFSHSFGGSPPLDTLWMSLDPPKDMPDSKKKLMAKNPPSCSFPNPPLRTSSDVSEESREKRRGEDNAFLMALDSMNREIVEKWGDMLRLFNCGTEEKKKKANLVLSSESHFNLTALVQGSEKSAESGFLLMASEPTEKTAKSDDPIERSKRSTEDFVREVSPMIAELGGMIEKLNMNDPTRV